MLFYCLLSYHGVNSFLHSLYKLIFILSITLFGITAKFDV